MTRTTRSHRPNGMRLRLPAVLLVAALATATAACGSSTSSGHSNHAPLVIGVLTDFTGTDAGYGPEAIAGCVPAANLINAAGGVLGHSVSCQEFNTASDPSDAVPESRKMISTTTNLAMALATGGDVAAAVVPILNGAHIPIFPSSGQALFDVNSYPYYWRMVAIDPSQGYAMAIATKSLGYARVAAVFSNTISALGSQPAFLKGMKLLGVPVIDSVTVPPSQASYESEIVALLEKKPQVIVGELDPPTAATFLSELAQLHGHLLPLLTDGVGAEVPWETAVGGAVGQAVMDRSVTLVLPNSNFTLPGFLAFKRALLASSVAQKSTYTTDVYAASYFDSVTLTALAALQAHSIVPSAFNQYIGTIANGSPGAVTVNTFAAGKAALSSGKKIHYVGASGPTPFTKYHNWEPPYNVSRLNSNGSSTLLAFVSESKLQVLLSQ